MTIAIAGYNGFIGAYIRKAYPEHNYVPLLRAELYGDITNLRELIKDVDVIINVAGYNVTRRWTLNTRKEIVRSRVLLTKNIVKAINSLQRKQVCFICASAIGIYAYDRVHTENDFEYGNTFLAEVLKDWEQAAEKVSKEVRLIKMRLGLVLGKNGGAFPRLLRLFKIGLGGIISTGDQVYSFIHIDDVAGAIMHLIENSGNGNYNFTAPNPISNRIFTKSLSRATGKPAILNVPDLFLRIGLGKASEIVTRGQTVYPKRLLDEGYKFTFATIDESLDNLVSRK